MPSVYSSVFQSFIRQGFTKSFTHGYAQSVVAATHPHVLNPQNRPSFARRRNAARVGRLTNLGLQSAFHNNSSNLPVTNNNVERRPDAAADNHGGLDAYYDQLQKTQDAEEDEKDWVQFQFPKQIEWKPTPASVLVGSDAKTLALDAEETADSVAADDAVSVGSGVPAEAQAALAHIDAALEREIEARRELAELEEKVESLRATSPVEAEKLAEEIRSRTATPLSAVETPATTVTPPVDQQSQTYADHLAKLSDAGRHAEIPAVFEAMLIGGVRPIAAAYNALLQAAIHIPSEKWEVVTKALDVYADMLRRKVSPDSETYNVLVGLLASRSLEISSLKQNLEDKRLRFGGMDEPGKFMFTSHELEHAILVEDDRLDLAMNLFRSSVNHSKAQYPSETYLQMISACAQAGRISDMLQLFGYMEASQTTPFAATFPAMITAFARSGDLVSAVECYNEYRSLAMAHDQGEPALHDRSDAEVYAAVVHGYVISDKLDGAKIFYSKISREYPGPDSEFRQIVLASGFMKGFIDRQMCTEAFNFATNMTGESKKAAMSDLAIAAADLGDHKTGLAAFACLPTRSDAAASAIALLASCVREGNVPAATRFWEVLCHSSVKPTVSFIEPTAMYAVAMIGSGLVADGLNQADFMFQRIRDENPQLADEVEEGTQFVSNFMTARGIVDPRTIPEPTPPQSFATPPFLQTAAVAKEEDSFDPYSHHVDLRVSALIQHNLEWVGAESKMKAKRWDSFDKLHKMRRAGRHPRYIIYAKLITAAGKEDFNMAENILAMAREDVPPLPQYPAVRLGWTWILDAMIAACLQHGLRELAEKYHQEVLAMGSTPSANTYGLYITTLRDAGKAVDEATEALQIFLRAKAEGVEPTSFLYNTVIGKLGKARRIDDCLFYFAEMRALGIVPTSVTYGTVINALCRVGDETFAEELFNTMEAMPNYKPRPAPYNSMMQFFLTTKRNKAKVIEYYQRMLKNKIAPTAHTFKLLVDSHATLEPVDMVAAEGVLEDISRAGMAPEAVHYAALIHAHGCILHDMKSARKVFDKVTKSGNRTMVTSACLYQALLEAMVANHEIAETESVVELMKRQGVSLTPYMANTLIHGWAAANKVDKAKEIYDAIARVNREPSTYEAMTRAYLSVPRREDANSVVSEMLTRGYASAVVNKVLELLGGPRPEGSAA
ncbi:hypothetical protein B0J18DRAFT_55009 [Chaetomium sp. MPI-SDFR-AT-0129]|nr:hypothetical protein B0J18DRAFT_55009 [Chaetomium sp. MPI-SDFR-AT-0129]